LMHLPKHLINISDVSDESLETLIRQALDIRESKMVPPGRVAGAAFFQPSTRTLLSFQSAAMRIGLPVLTLSGVDGTRLGDFYNESPEDAILYMQHYCDLLIVRHYQELDEDLVAQLEVPLINAGDGYNSHPTQAIGDVTALTAALGTDIQSVSVGILGALNIRTTRSFIQTLNRVSAAKIVVISAPQNHYGGTCEDDWIKVGSKAELLRACDVVYVSGFEHADFSRDRTSPRIHKQAPLLTESDLVDANGNIMIMHPGPKTHDIDQSLDRFPNNLIWKQALYATNVRQLLLGAYAERGRR
jgi:aspartate carbamoyltransferase catalytic subunit